MQSVATRGGTNIDLLGSDLERKARISSAQAESSWDNAGEEVGLEIWRIENFGVKPWPKEQYGQFYSGDSYIVLNTYRKNPRTESLAYDVHFWIGNDSTQDEYVTAAYKTVELDERLGGAPVQHREVQGHESKVFMSYFPTMRLLSGGVESGFSHVKPEEYKPRLLHVRTAKGTKTVVVEEVPLTVKSLNKSDAFILDTGLNLYQFTPSGASGMERLKAAQLARALDNERKGMTKLTVFDENDRQKVFWDALGGKAEIPKEVDDAPMVKKRLFRLSDASGELTFTEITPVAKSALDSDDVFVFDAGYQIFVWVGKHTTKNEKMQAMLYATDYMEQEGRPRYLPVTRIMEGAENDNFNASWTL